MDPEKVKRSDFQYSIGDQVIDLFNLGRNKTGIGNIRVAVSNYGARLIAVYVPNGEGKIDDVVVGSKTIGDLFDGFMPYAGAVIGRYANRIANGSFELYGKKYNLDINLEPHHIHGGSKGFHQAIWNIEEYSDSKITFQLTSPHGSSGYPGTVDCSVSYTLLHNDSLKISYTARTDRPTIINVTNHAYFNLSGQEITAIGDYRLKIDADSYTPVNQTLIPTGEISKVSGTPFDFSEFKPIKEHIDRKHEQIEYGDGFDQNFVLNHSDPSGTEFAAAILDPQTSRKLEVYTTEPGLQLYTTEVSNDNCNKSVIRHAKRGEIHNVICFETQHFPDSPNNPHFPSTVLEPDEVFTSTTIYRFIN